MNKAPDPRNKPKNPFTFRENGTSFEDRLEHDAAALAARYIHVRHTGLKEATEGVDNKIQVFLGDLPPSLKQSKRAEFRERFDLLISRWDFAPREDDHTPPATYE
jgi:hypothetical protein